MGGLSLPERKKKRMNKMLESAPFPLRLFGLEPVSSSLLDYRSLPDHFSRPGPRVMSGESDGFAQVKLIF
jgi:hypothetical protein